MVCEFVPWNLLFEFCHLLFGISIYDGQNFIFLLGDYFLLLA